MDKHTKELLTRDEKRGHILADEAHDFNHIVAESVPADYSRRFLACWNACAGIPTESLEAGVVGELVEACKNTADILQGGDKLDKCEPWAQELIGTLRAALAKAKGGA